jgi:hypothetical protein
MRPLAGSVLNAGAWAGVLMRPLKLALVKLSSLPLTVISSARRSGGAA